MRLKRIRERIDIIDTEILNLLNERLELALESRGCKDCIEDPEREKEILNRVFERRGGVLKGEFCRDLYSMIFEESKRLQEREPQFLLFQGEHGAYSEMAAEVWSRDLVKIPIPTFSQLFEMVESGDYKYGIVPVENTLGGMVTEVNNLLMNTQLKVVGAIDFRVKHSLLIRKGGSYRDIKRVLSHPQALAQCREFIKRNNLEPLTHYDTAGAAKELNRNGGISSGIIASSEAGKIYNLETVKAGVEDLENNRTRFLILSKEECSVEIGDKCSIRFTTEHKAGTLFKVLELLSRRGLNLTRIESIPAEPGNYTFLLDFLGSISDENVKDGLDEVEAVTTDMRILGCYKEIVV